MFELQNHGEVYTKWDAVRHGGGGVDVGSVKLKLYARSRGAAVPTGFAGCHSGKSPLVRATTDSRRLLVAEGDGRVDL